MAVYAIYIGRVSNLEDFVIGTPILNRSNYKEKQTMGMFINTVPVRMNIKGEENFASFSRLLGKDMMSILKHQKYSYNQILEDLRNRNTNIPNLYNVMISYQITKAFSKEYGDYKTDWIFNGYVSDDLDIHITDLNDTGELKVSYDYLVDKYTEKNIEDMHKRIVYMINQVLDNEEILTSEIEIVTEEERNRILNDFNNTKVDYPKDKTIVDLFEEQVEKTPDNIAVVFEDEKLTYKELNEKANSLARYLREKEIGRNDLVGIMVNRSLEMIIAIFAVLKAGGAYIPIDPTYPKDRIEYMLDSSKAKILLTQKHLQDKTKFKNKALVDLDNNKTYAFPNENLKHINKPDDLAYVIFTSGSTGLPKGVMLMHRNIINFIYGMMRELKFSNKDVIASITTISFDIFVLESIMPLINGMKVVIANEKEQINVESFNKLCIKNNVNIIQTTPSRIRLFLLDSNQIDFIKQATHILIGGEPFPEVLFDNLKNATNARIYNMYGPTETAVWSAMKSLRNSEEITIGKPISNTQIYILDNNLKHMPIGVRGEIYISGDGVSKGYLNNKELTDKSFIKNPYSEGTLMYKTGDLGLFKYDGEIICLGRVDNQVKIRGLRIELGEIEEKISKINGINSCAVVKKGDNSSHEFLCAYYTSNVELDLINIRRELEKELPQYMVPNYFIHMENLPYTPNGKIDRKNLPEPDIKKIKKEVIFARNEIDSKLIEIFKDTLSINVVSIKDSFFELGGDSLSAINLCSRINKEFKIELSIKDIFDLLFVQDISDLIAKKLDNNQEKSINKVQLSDYYPASSAQKRMYFASKVAGNETTLYNIPGGVIFDGEIDTKKLENCLNILLHRHESLRTYFEVIDENVFQRILDNVEFKLDTLENQRYENIDNIFKEFVKPFDLSKAPLFRAKFITFTNKKSALFIDMHHIISDGTSIEVFVEELCKLYSGEKLSTLNITYKDYAVYENKQIKEGKLKEAENYWVQKFEGEVPVLNMPTNHRRPAIQSFDGNKVYSLIDTTTTKQIEQLAKSLNITPYMLLVSVYYILLSKYTSQDDIVIGTPVVGRDIAEVQNVLGMFVNTLALREKIDNEMPFKEFIMQVKDDLVNSYKYQTYPFDELVRKLNIKRDTSRNPLFDTMFIYQNRGYKEIKLGKTKTQYYIPNTNISKFDLSLEAIPINNEIKLSFEYATKLFDEEFIKNISRHYLNILKEVLENIEIKISNISMISENETNKILHDFNNTKTDFGINKSIAEIFEEQAKKTPDNVAVVFEGKKLTYRELDEKSSALANYLKEKKLTNNDTVCIALNRSLELIISIYAVIKCGSPYIVIDTSFPEERINYIIDNSEARYGIISSNSPKFKDVENLVDISNFEFSKYDTKTEIIAHKDNFCMIYTSGSTGNPKGVLLHEKGLINLIYAFDKEVETSKFKNILGIATVSFDMFAFELLSATLFGNTLVLANEEEQKNIVAMSNLMKQNNVEFMITTPSRIELLMLDDCGNPLKDLKALLLGGEKVTSSLYNKLKNVTEAKIINTYGPTEITAGCTTKLLNSEDITIGKPVSNMQIYICDPNLRLQPVGIVGEICVAGVGVANGYKNKKEQTDKSFVKNPYGEGLIYKTGDLGKYRENGEIEYIGRSDFQVKIRGLRIELEEIETLMLKYPNIKKAVVIKQTVPNREYLSAYFVANKRIVINELRKYLTKKLPLYMVPSYFTPLDDFPYTASGKIDRKLLPIPTDIFDVTSSSYTPPNTELEKKLVRIWEKVLNTKPIGINDNFFELGGDSILAMNLNLELMKISNRIKYADIFRFPTIAEQEEKINSNDDSLMFSKIENLSDNYVYVLKNNKNKEKIKTWHPRNILLTGGTGFLGIHVLDEFIKKECGKIYCIVRDEPGLTAKAKLHQKLNYYFGDKYDDLIGKRIFAVTGSITKPGFGLNQEELLELANSVDVVINCAARVLHYGNYDDFYNSNVRSVRYIIDFCKSFNIKLYHISTTGVAGDKSDISYLTYGKKNKKEVIFDESSLYVGQILDNVYTRSKFEAESYVLNAISRGLDGYILRMGNLMPRYSDGFFQENILDNAFINKLAAFVKIGFVPDYMLKELLEFTPIDFAAKAVYALITHPTYRNRIFHLNNNKNITVNKYIRVLRKINYDIKVLPEKEFKDSINLILNDENEKKSLNNLLNDFDKDLHLNYKNDIIVMSDFTIKYLKRIHFRWPKISNRYLIKFVNLLRKVI